MSGDFVKQLQLAKQLEQKAKEAARGRETAEKSIQEATALLDKLKEMDASPAETGKLLTLASQSYSDKDYKESLSYSVKSIDAADRSRKERLREILREASSLMERVSTLGKAEEETTRSLSEAAKAIDSSDSDGTYELCKGAWDMAEQNANRVVSEAFGRAQSSMLFAERLELKVDKQKTMLRSCRDALESGDIVKSVDLIQSLLGVLKSMTMERFTKRSGKIDELLSLKKSIDFDTAPARSLMEKAREAIVGARVEDAFLALDNAEESFSGEFGGAVVQRLADLRQRTGELVAHGQRVDLGDVAGKVQHMELQEKYSDVIQLLDGARDKVRSAEKAVLLHEMTAIQPRLKLAHIVKKDVRDALQKMEESRVALKADLFEDALALVEEARSIVEEKLNGYDQVEEELRQTQELRARCDDLGLPCTEGSKEMGAAKRQTLQGDFVTAIDSLRQAQQAFKQKLENYFATDIMRLEMRLATSMRLGADVSEESALLESLTARVRKGDFELVHGSLVTIGSSVEEKTLEVVTEELRQAENLMSHYADRPEAERGLVSLKQAKERLLKKEYQQAHDQARQVVTTMNAERRKNLDQSIREGKALMDMAGQLDAESVTLREKMQRSEELKALGRMDEASVLAEEVISYGRSIVSSEVDKQLTDLMQHISMARKNGVEVGHAEHLTEQGSQSLRRDDLSSAFELTMSARRSLQEVVALYQSLRERLDEKEELLEETKRANMDIPEVRELVIKSGELLRSGEYDEAGKELDKAEATLREKASPFILSLKIKQLKEMVKLRDKLGYKDSEARLKQFEELDASRLDESTGSLAKLKEEWEGEITASLNKELNVCQKEVDKISASGLSMGHVQQLLARGRNSLSDRKLLDSMRAIELIRVELDQSVQADRRLNDILAQVEDAVEQLKDMKLDTKEVLVLLEQARALKRTGSAPVAADLATKAMDRSLSLAKERILSLMNFAGGLTTERMNWEDLRTARKLSDDIDEALAKHRYRHAHLLARSFREELERVLQDKSTAEEELRKFEARLKEEAAAGLRLESSMKALEKTRALMARGRFVQALGGVNIARDELKSLTEMYDSRLMDYNALREMVNSLEVLDPRKDNMEELLDQCWSSLKIMQFESASLYLRRARNALSDFLTTRTNELLWEFNPLHDLIKRMKLQKKFGTEISEIEKAAVDHITPRDLNTLERNVERVRAGMKDIFHEQREKARRTIEKSSRADKETGRAWEIWSDSESQSDRGDLWEAFNSLETAVNAIGRKGAETAEQLQKQLTNMLEKANSYRIELGETEKAYAEALALIKQGKNPMSHLKRACDISRKEVRATYPDITAELEFVGEAKEGGRMDVVVHLKNDADYDARIVRAFIFGDAEVKGMVEVDLLKAGQEAKGRITIIPMNEGLLTLGISVKCKPMLTEEDVLYDSKFDLDVK